MNKYNNDFDKLIETAARLADEELGSEIKLPENKVEFSDEHIEEMNRLFKSAHRYRRTRSPKRMRLLVCAVIAAGLLMFAGVFSVGAWRSRIMSFVINDSSNTDIRILTENSNYYRDKYISVDYIPEGFEVTENDNGVEHRIMVFDNNDLYFILEAHDIGTNCNTDTEDSIQENIKIRNYNGIYIENPRIKTVVYNTDTKIFIISGNIPKDELIKIAENVYMN